MYEIPKISVNVNIKNSSIWKKINNANQKYVLNCILHINLVKRAMVNLENDLIRCFKIDM